MAVWIVGAVAACGGPAAGGTTTAGTTIGDQTTGGDTTAATCDDRITALQATLDELTAADGSTGAILGVSTRDCGTWVGAVGLADSSAGTEATPGHIFSAGSISKLFTATIAMQLVAEGKLSLDDPLTNWFPDLPNASAITIRMLLDHTSGLYNYVDSEEARATAMTDPGHVWTLEELLGIVAQGTPYFAPGEGWHYTNTGFVVLGAIAERLTDKSFGALLHERILEPLELRATSYPVEDAPAAEVMHTYLLIPEGPQIDTWVHPTAFGPAGSIDTTAVDALAFLDALLAGDLLPEAARAQMTAMTPTPYEGYSWGLGISAHDTDHGRLLGHDSDGPGESAELWWSERLDATIVVFASSQTENFAFRIVEAVLEVLARSCGRAPTFADSCPEFQRV